MQLAGLPTVARRRLAVAALAAGLAGCGGDAGPAVPPPVGGAPVVAAMRVQASATRILPDDTVTVTATPVDARGQPVPGAPVQWLWDHPQFTTAVVDGATLRLTSATPRDVQITPVSGGHSATVTVRVRYPDAGVILFLGRPRDTMTVGGIELITAVALDSLGRTVPLPARPTLASADPAVVRIEGDPGAWRVRAVGAGTGYVVATFGAARDSLAVHVRAAPRDLFPDTNALYPGLTRTLRAREIPAGMAPDTLAVDRWLSSDPAVARVSDAGVVTAVAVGRATVSAVAGRDTLRALVVVKPTPPPLEFVAVLQGTACAIARDGGVWCWGTDDGGRLGTTEVVDRCESFGYYQSSGLPFQLGRSTYRCAPFPVRVQSDERFVAGAGSCALTAAGAVHCWGAGGRATPAPVPAAPDGAPLRVVAIEGTCLLTADGAVHCRELFPTPGPARLVPSPVAFRQISVDGHGCGVTADDVAYCWGANWTGQLGTENPTVAPGCVTACELSPKRVANLPATRQIQAGPGAATCAIDLAGRMRCWGASPQNGLRHATSVPTTVAGMPPLVALVRTTLDHCGLTAGGELWCVVIGASGVEGGARRVALPFALRTEPGATNGACGIATDGYLYCWGQGFLGDGRPASQSDGSVARVAWQR